MKTRSPYTALGVPAPECAEPGETIETRARETVDNDCEDLFVDMVLRAQPRLDSTGQTLYGKLGRPADLSAAAGGTTLTATVESYDEDNLVAESITVSL